MHLVPYYSSSKPCLQWNTTISGWQTLVSAKAKEKHKEVALLNTPKPGIQNLDEFWNKAADYFAFPLKHSRVSFIWLTSEFTQPFFYLVVIAAVVSQNKPFSYDLSYFLKSVKKLLTHNPWIWGICPLVALLKTDSHAAYDQYTPQNYLMDWTDHLKGGLPANFMINITMKKVFMENGQISVIFYETEKLNLIYRKEI